MVEEEDDDGARMGRRRRRMAVAVRSTTVEMSATSEGEKKNGPEVLVAGGGIAGLIAAAACRRKGMKVKVFEKVKKYEPFGGPIQLQCNAQGALDSIDPVMAEEVMEKESSPETASTGCWMA